MPQIKRKHSLENLELRQVIDFRAEQTETEKIIKGYAVPFDSPADIGGMFTETFLPGSFTKTIAEFDQMMVWSHDYNKPLARRLSGTLFLREDDKGLYFEARLNNTSWANDAYEAIKNKDVHKMSAGFNVINDDINWRTEGDGNNKKYFRDIREVKLWEISPVIWPAFDDTFVEARSILAAQFPQDFTPEPITEPDKVHSADHLAAELLKNQQAKSNSSIFYMREKLRFLEI